MAVTYILVHVYVCVCVFCILYIFYAIDTIIGRLANFNDSYRIIIFLASHAVYLAPYSAAVHREYAHFVSITLQQYDETRLTPLCRA